MKNHENFVVFRGNIVADITRNTSSDQGMLFGTFLMKNIFIDFPTPILKHIFCYIQLKNSCFLEVNLIVLCEYIMIVQLKPMKIIEIFDEILQKWCFKIGVGKSMKIFFIRNVPNNIPWSLKVFLVMPVTIFPRKTMKNSCFFLPVWHCGTLYSKSVIPCARPSTVLWRPAARQLQNIFEAELLKVISRRAPLLCLWWFTNAP